MKLYYTPGACSLSPHIVLIEAGVPYQLIKTDLRAKKTETGDDFFKVNPDGYVPALVTDDGTVVTEGPVIVQYIADTTGKNMAPKAGTAERYQLQSKLNFISTELHKGFAPLFNPAMPEEGKKIIMDRLKLRVGSVDKQLAGKAYIMGDAFSLADAYLFTVLSWAPRVKLDLAEFSNVQAYMERLRARPSVQKAMQEEGLI
jgi:glutathione S-transferase